AHGLLVVLHEAREVTTAVERHGPVLRAFTHARIGPQDHVAHAAQDWFCRLAGQPFLYRWVLLQPHQDRKTGGPCGPPVRACARWTRPGLGPSGSSARPIRRPWCRTASPVRCPER